MDEGYEKKAPCHLVVVVMFLAPKDKFFTLVCRKVNAAKDKKHLTECTL
jgi:hypothetical protein